MEQKLNKTDSAYHDLLKDIIENGTVKEDRTGTGTKSVFGRQIRFNMKDGFPILTTKKLHTRSIIHELLWFLQGDTNIKYLNDNGVTIWDEWADENGDLGPIYGKQWVKWTPFNYGRRKHGIDAVEIASQVLQEELGAGINQIQVALDTLKNNPTSRRILVNAWNVSQLQFMKLPPCHYGFQLITRPLSDDERIKWAMNNLDLPLENVAITEAAFSDKTPKYALSLMWNQRSVDTFLGLPFNIMSYALLLHMFAQQANMVPEELIGSLGDVHIYSNHIEYVEEQLSRSSTDCFPILVMKKAKDMFSYKIEDFSIFDYVAHPNWKNVPIAV